MKKVICPKCGASWTTNIRSCPDCETSLVNARTVVENDSTAKVRAKDCPHCGAPVKGLSATCQQCGKNIFIQATSYSASKNSVDSKTAQTIKCPHCNTDNYDYSTNCYQCHKPLKEMPKPTQQPTSLSTAKLLHESDKSLKETQVANPRSNLIYCCVALICIVVCMITGMITYSVGKNKTINQAVVAEMADRIIETDNKYQSELKTLTAQHEEKLSLLEAERIEKSTELESLKREVKSNEKIVIDLNEYKANKEALNDEIRTKQNTISSLDAKIKVKSAELDFLTGKAIKAVSEPKRLGAGVFTVGADLPAGRYSVTGSSNFVVYDSSGSLKVNTILGGGSYAVANYTCNLEIGDEMELDSACAFTPID